MKQQVEITHGLFKGKCGVLSEPFNHHGQAMRVVYISEVDNLTGIQYLSYATVDETEYKVI